MTIIIGIIAFIVDVIFVCAYASVKDYGFGFWSFLILGIAFLVCGILLIIGEILESK